MTRIRIADPDIGDTERSRIEAVLRSGQLADGSVVREFERDFAAFCGADHGVATTNGTTALQTALVSLGVGSGDTVLTTPFSFVATANAVRFAGASLVFADIDPVTFNLDPDAVEELLRERGDDIDAILAVHLYGLPARMDRLRTLAEAYDCALIEDAAQAHGAEFRGAPVGSLADAACFSFYPTKNMTTGEGGMVLTDHDSVAERAACFINHGRTEAYAHDTLGHNFRLPSMAAAMGLAQLEKLPTFIERRRENAAALTAELADVPGVVTPTEPADVRHAYHQYTVRMTNRDGLAAYLDDQGIDSGVYYPTPIHRLGAYEGTTARTPHADRAAEVVLSIPVHPGVSRDDIETIAEAVAAYSTEPYPIRP